MEEILRAIYNDQEKRNPFHLYELVGIIRPEKIKNYDLAARQISQLIDLIKKNPDYRAALGTYIKNLFSAYDTVHLFVETGIMSLKGFSYELYNKVKHRILPSVENEKDIRRLLNQVFYRSNDYKWIEAIPDNLWEELISQIGVLQHFKKQDKEDTNFNRLISSIQILSHRISALGTESEITNKMPQLDEINSPFLQQNKEVTIYIDNFNETTDIENEDYKHILVILNQCEESIRFLRKNKNKFGTSLRLTFLIRRLNQQIERLRLLLLLIHQNETQKFCHTTVSFFKVLIKSENQKNSISKHLRDNVDLLAFQVVEHAARTGVSYIATGRKEFGKFLFKSLKGGIIVAFFALTKILLNQVEFSPFGYAVVQSLNYTFAFVLIFFTRSILATTQPAMTASTIAGSLEKNLMKPIRLH
ncbi:MAG: site-specific recombinase [Bacteroidales bacterium]|nr:site-specific recombinase [Bacteroidales bacterium]MCF8386891.1 site-specific recombinase [Bacteroidales bacterium]MCF8399386.1 site-specific recombinase [Bacteroidales bacterium]